jgi:hypothetical protein
MWSGGKDAAQCKSTLKEEKLNAISNKYQHSRHHGIAQLKQCQCGSQAEPSQALFWKADKLTCR